MLPDDALLHAPLRLLRQHVLDCFGAPRERDLSRVHVRGHHRKEVVGADQAFEHVDERLAGADRFGELVCHVNQEDHEHPPPRVRGLASPVVGAHRVATFLARGGGRQGHPLELRDGLGRVVLEQLEVVGGEVGDWLAFGVGRVDVHTHEVGLDTEGRLRRRGRFGRRLWRRRLLRAHADGLGVRSIRATAARPSSGRKRMDALRAQRRGWRTGLGVGRLYRIGTRHPAAGYRVTGNGYGLLSPPRPSRAHRADPRDSHLDGVPSPTALCQNARTGMSESQVEVACATAVGAQRGSPRAEDAWPDARLVVDLAGAISWRGPRSSSATRA